MSLAHVAIIGFGAIGQDLVEILRAAPDDAPARLSVLVREGREEDTRAALKDPDIAVTSDLETLLANRPDLIAECAGHGAVAAFGPTILARGIDLVVASVGALADVDLKHALETAAQETGAQCVVPAGAIGGIDALGAARLSGLKSVTYSGRKPPRAWLGSPAEDSVDLHALDKECVFFEGTARAAAQTLALAGLGMDETRVRLIADPAASENIHEFAVTSEALDFSVRLVGKPSPRNPKTSRSTVYSIARAVLNRGAAIAI